MTPPLLSISRRTRRTPFSARVVAAGVRAYTVYNHMLLPTAFRSLEEDYRHLKTAVQLWDVSCERQVRVAGPDAARLMQRLTPRDMSRAREGRCFYVPMVDARGGMINDPVALKIAEDEYWISVADSDVILWTKGVATGADLAVEIEEPDISPLGVQGPLADEVVAAVFGEAARGIGFFGYRRLPFMGRDLVVARSGYSRQGGFEIYVEGADIAEPLWDALMSAGAPHDIRAGCPNLIERIEGGLLSYGNDMTRENTPYECGLGRFCEPETAIGCIGREALLRVSEDGPARMIRGLRVGGASVPPCMAPWPVVSESGDVAGQVTSCVWSPDFGTNVAIGMIEAAFWTPGERLQVEAPDGARPAIVCDLPFAPPP